MTLLAGLLGFGGMRSFEKHKGVAARWAEKIEPTGHYRRGSNAQRIRSAACVYLHAYLRFKAWDVHLFETAEEFLSVAIPLTPSVVLIDVQLPRMSGLDLQARKGEISRSVPFVFMSGALSVTDGVAAMKGGAVEFLVKPVDPEELCQAVERALMLDAEFLEEQRCAAELVRQLEDLSPRERQVHELLLRGANNVQITNELGISINTAKQYKSEVMRKFGVSNLADLIAASARTNVDRFGGPLGKWVNVAQFLPPPEKSGPSSPSPFSPSEKNSDGSDRSRSRSSINRNTS